MVTRTEMQGIQGWFCNGLGLLPVDQGKPWNHHIALTAVDLLAAGQQLVVFPEGSDSRRQDGPIRLLSGRPGWRCWLPGQGWWSRLCCGAWATARSDPRRSAGAALCFGSVPPLSMAGGDQRLKGPHENWLMAMQFSRGSGREAVGASVPVPRVAPMYARSNVRRAPLPPLASPGCRHLPPLSSAGGFLAQIRSPQGSGRHRHQFNLASINALLGRGLMPPVSRGDSSAAARKDLRPGQGCQGHGLAGSLAADLGAGPFRGLDARIPRRMARKVREGPGAPGPVKPGWRPCCGARNEPEGLSPCWSRCVRGDDAGREGSVAGAYPGLWWSWFSRPLPTRWYPAPGTRTQPTLKYSRRASQNGLRSF